MKRLIITLSLIAIVAWASSAPFCGWLLDSCPTSPYLD